MYDKSLNVYDMRQLEACSDGENSTISTHYSHRRFVRSFGHKYIGDITLIII